MAGYSSVILGSEFDWIECLGQSVIWKSLVGELWICVKDFSYCGQLYPFCPPFSNFFYLGYLSVLRIFTLRTFVFLLSTASHCVYLQVMKPWKGIFTVRTFIYIFSDVSQYVCLQVTNKCSHLRHLYPFHRSFSFYVSSSYLSARRTFHTENICFSSLHRESFCVSSGV